MMDFEFDGPAVPEEALSPYKIIVSILIREYLRLQKELDPSIQQTKSSSKDKDKEDCKSFLSRSGLTIDKLSIPPLQAYSTLRLLQHLARSADRSFTSVISLVRPVITEAHFLLLRRGIELIRKDDAEETIRYVEGIFDTSLRHICLKTDASPFALFLRNVRLLFWEMTIGELETLNSELLSYVKSGVHLFEGLEPKTSVTSRRKRSISAKPNTALGSEFILQQEASLLLSNSSKAGADSQGQLSTIFAMNPLPESAQFVGFLDAIRRKDYSQAERFLHEFFDLKTAQESNTEQGAGLACLHLCILHHKAGHCALSLRYLRECVFIAQEKADIGLLTSAMYWVAVLEVNKDQHEKIAYGVNYPESPSTMSQEVRSLFALAHCKLGIQAGSSIKKMFDDLEELDKTCNWTNGSIISVNCLRGSLWKAMGFDWIATLYAQGNVLIFSSQRAGKFPIANESFAFSAACLVENAYRCLDEIGEKAITGYFESVFPREKYPDWSIWGSPLLNVRYSKAFLKLDFRLCEDLADQLIVVDVSEGVIRKIELEFVVEHRTKEALVKIDQLLETCEVVSGSEEDLATSLSLSRHLRLLLLKADILLKADCAVDALNVILKALSLVADHLNQIWIAKVQCKLAEVWLALGELDAAEAIFRICSRMLVGSGCVGDQANCWFLKGVIGYQRRLTEETGKERLLGVKEDFSRALACFEASEDVMGTAKTLDLLIEVCDLMGVGTEKERYAGLLLELTEKMPHFANI